MHQFQASAFIPSHRFPAMRHPATTIKSG